MSRVSMVIHCASFCLWLLDYGTSLSSCLEVWGRLHVQPRCSSEGVLPMMPNAQCQNLHNTLRTLLPWTMYHYLWGPTWACRTWNLCSIKTWLLLLTWCLPLALLPSILWVCQWLRRDICSPLEPWAAYPWCRFPKLWKARRDRWATAG
jgi:hypothetical protein